MYRRQKKRSGERITGSLEPFEVERLQKILLAIFSGGDVVVENLLDIFREDSKIVVALRMRPAVDMNRSIDTISVASRDIITKYLNTHMHEADTGYIICTLRYFSGEKKHNVELNLNCASCKSLDPKKALAHARADCEKYKKTNINRVLRRLKEKPWSNLSAEKVANLRIQYESIEFSIKFVCAYLTQLCNGELPKNLGEEVFAEASAYDPTIAAHYDHMEGCGIYSLNNNPKHLFASVNQECATYIFCSTYR